MKTKVIITIFLVANCIVSCFSRAALRRTPKVYNALITTDDNLTSSQAFPVIQPTIHETGISHFPFGYYSPPIVRFGHPIAPGLVPQERLPYPLPHAQFPTQLMRGQSIVPGYSIPQQHPPTASASGEVVLEGSVAAATETIQGNIEKPHDVSILEEQHPVVPPQGVSNQQYGTKYLHMEESGLSEMPNGKLPILLNEYGLPPSLIPLQQYPISTRNGLTNTNANPVNLPPYAFNQYPLLPGYYNPVSGFREQYLTPFDFAAIPHQTYGVASAAAATGKQVALKPPSFVRDPFLPVAQPQPNQQSIETSNPISDATQIEAASNPATAIDEPTPDFESIKNGSENKNSDVPDVPPPPIPSGAKIKASS